MALPVTISGEALADFYDLENYIAEASYPLRAIRYIERLTRFCQTIGAAPSRGQRHDDVRPGLRSIGFERRITVAFLVTDVDVTITGIYYAGKRPPFKVRPF